MTVQETTASLPSLGIAATVSDAYSAVFGQVWLLCKAAALPFVLSLVIGGIGAVILETHLALDIGIQLLGLLPVVIFGIAWSRIVLIGPQSGAIPRPLLGRRTWIYFGYTLVQFMLIILPMIALAFVAAGTAFLESSISPAFDLESSAAFDLESSAARVFLMVPVTFAVYLILLYFLIRLALVFPAVALDQKLGLSGSWRLTRGNGLKLYLAMILVIIPVVVATMIGGALLSSFLFVGLDQPHASLVGPGGGFDWMTLALIAAPATVFSVLVQYVTFGLIVAAFAKAYAHLSGWGGPREEVLQRFE